MRENKIVGEIIDSSTANPDATGKSIADYKEDKTSERHYYGDALNDDNVNDIIDDVVPHVVVIIGFPKYGKSTFVASLYHAVLTIGKIGKFRVAGLLLFNSAAYINRIQLFKSAHSSSSFCLRKRSS